MSAAERSPDPSRNSDPILSAISLISNLVLELAPDPDPAAAPLSREQTAQVLTTVCGLLRTAHVRIGLIRRREEQLTQLPVERFHQLAYRAGAAPGSDVMLHVLNLAERALTLEAQVARLRDELEERR